jgi:CelD/BcsL family acetyltransferase involved in cellulose biosynthesis
VESPIAPSAGPAAGQELPVLQQRWVSLPLRVGEITLKHLRFDLQVANEPLAAALAHRVLQAKTLAAARGAAEGLQLKGAWTDAAGPGLVVQDGWIRYLYSVYPRYYLDLRAGYAAYLGKFSSKSQYNLRRQRRVYFEKQGVAPALVCARTPEEVEDFYRRARKVSELTYQEKLLGSGLPAGADFVARMHEAARAGQVRGYLLPGADGRDAAYMYCLVAGDDLVCKYIGYDPEVATLSPGSTLLLMAIEQLCNEGELRYFDFEEGGAQYKKQFATGSEPCGNLLLLPNRPAHRLKLVAHAGLAAAMRRAGALADRLGVRAAIRRMVRRAA